MKILTLFSFIIFISFAFSQKGKIQGKVVDKYLQEEIIGAIVSVEKTDINILTDFEGNFSFELAPGTYNLTCRSAGFSPLTKFNIVLTTGNPQVLNFELLSQDSTIEVTVTDNKSRNADATDMTTPLSVQRLTSEEIKSNPGGNYDVSKVVQTLPGVGGAQGGAARNDIIIRGGAPNENVYYLDGIEIPVLNHFQTQGSSGGAQGIVNVSFIEDVKLTSSAFDARYDNALASTFVIKQRQGNSDKLAGNVRASFTESAFTLEGPLGKKTNFLASGRISYLDFLFQLIDLPIRPKYQDYQVKTTTKLNEKTTLSFIGVGAIDDFSFGKTRNSSPENEYLRRSLPIIKQWTYTNGLAVRRQISKGFVNFALSRNMFNNDVNRYKNAQYGVDSLRNFGLNSQEIENKFRVDVNKFVNGWKYSYGFNAQYVKYSTDLYSKIIDQQTDSLGNVVVPALEVRFDSKIAFARYGFFGQIAKNFFKNKLLISTGFRSDMNTFTKSGNNPLKTFSPRLSAAYTLNNAWQLTGSIGQYFKLPSYTILGYKNASNQFENKDVNYIKSTHYVLGTQFLPKQSLRFTFEAFFKQYEDYPVSTINGISLANQGAEFGAVGNEKVTSIGKGQTFGFEVFAQQKLTKKVFYFVSYTFVRSLFSGVDKKLIPSAWDNQHLLSGTVGYKFGKNWQLGVKYRLAGGAPYTPFNLALSQQNFPLLGTGILDYSKVNTERLNLFSQFDLRIDKTWNFKKTSMIFFLDIQNLFLQKQQSPSYFTFKRKADNSDFETTNGLPLSNDGSNGIPLLLENNSATPTPTIGIIFEF